MEHTLINFNMPNHLKRSFDNLVKFKRVSRTSLMNRLIEDYVRSELSHLEQDGRIDELMSDIETRSATKPTPQPQPQASTWARWEDSY